MKTVGIITEYNPFHQGHIYHIQKAKQYGDVLVAICSGFYSQRGLPSLISRQDKTKLALQNGVDLVLELCFTECRLLCEICHTIALLFKC